LLDESGWEIDREAYHARPISLLSQKSGTRDISLAAVWDLGGASCRSCRDRGHGFLLGGG
jgi:hypothetical protein